MDLAIVDVQVKVYAFLYQRNIYVYMYICRDGKVRACVFVSKRSVTEM